LFQVAHEALYNLETALTAALDEASVEEGRFTMKRGDLTAELQWPYQQWYSPAGKSVLLPLRFIVQGIIPPVEATAPEPGLIPACGDPRCDDGAL